MTEPADLRDMAEKMVADIAAVLNDPDANLSISTRHRYEGALSVLEALLGIPSSQTPDLDLPI